MLLFQLISFQFPICYENGTSVHDTSCSYFRIHCLLKYHQMQSQTADFAPGTASWRTGRNIRVVFDPGHSLHYCENNIIHITHGTASDEIREPRPQVTCTENLMKFIDCGFCDTQANRQTDRPTDTHTRRSQYFTRLPAAK